MPTYRISDATHERLKRWAIPLEDNRDDVIRRVLDVAEGKAVEVESLHFHARSRLAESIEGFLSQQQPAGQVLSVNPSDIAPRLAEHILSTWLEDRQQGGGGNDRPDAG